MTKIWIYKPYKENGNWHNIDLDYLVDCHNYGYHEVVAYNDNRKNELIKKIEELREKQKFKNNSRMEVPND